MGRVTRRRDGGRVAGDRAPLAVVLTGSRNLAKRTCRFVEGLAASGLDPVVVSIPRRPWGISGMEQPDLVAHRGMLTARAADRQSAPRRPEVVVCMHWAMLPLAVAVKLLSGSRLIYDEHDHYEMLALEAAGSRWTNQMRALCVRACHAWGLPQADLVTCIRMTGGYLRDHLQQRAVRVVELHNYPAQRWQVPVADLELDAESDPHDAGGDAPLALVYVGGLWEVKGVGAMLDAYAALSRDLTLPPLELHIFGSGHPELERRARESSGVVFHGTAGWDRIHGLLTTRDCVGLVLLEPTPRYQLVSTNCHKIFEYMASGVPVVATDVGDLPQIVEDADAGWVIAADYQARDLADLLGAVVRDQPERRRRGRAGAAAVREGDMSWEVEWRKVADSGALTPGSVLATPATAPAAHTV